MLLLKKKRFPRPRLRVLLPVSKDLVGRVGGFALRGPEHFVFVLMYWPPPPMYGRQRQAYHTTCERMYEWALNTLSSFQGA
eukprot:1547299-Pyramimonas_sp.AAC.1